MNPDVIKWQPVPLIVSLLLSAFLFITYIVPATAAIWHVPDVAIAYALNGLVTDNHFQQLIWSIGNLRIADYIAGLVMLGILVHYVRNGQRYTRSERTAQAFIIGLMLIVLVAITREFLFHGIDNPSPSLVLKPFTLLDETNDLGAKSSSGSSFPGDHATVVFTYVFLLSCAAGWRYGLAAFVVAILAVLPRMVAGAHWMTDIIVGGGGTALFTVPWVVYTPLGSWLVSRLAPRLAWAGSLIGR